MQKTFAQHQEEIRLRDEELQKVKSHNGKLIKEKDHITQQHIQESYVTNLNLHRWIVELE